MPVPRTQEAPTNIAHAVVIKDKDVFFISEIDGSVPPGNQDGFGLYYHDCRFLSGYTFRAEDLALTPLGATSDRGSIAQFELTNRKLQSGESNGSIPQHTIGITVQRVIDSDECVVRDLFAIENYSVQSHRLSLTFEFRVDFDDIFEIRGLHPKNIGRESPPQWKQGVLVFHYDGADGVVRELHVHPAPAPQKLSECAAEFSLHLNAGERREIRVNLHIIERKQRTPPPQQQVSPQDVLTDKIRRRSEDWLNKHASVTSDNPLLNAALRRSVLDLLVLRSSLDHHDFFSAGLPWYGALFGRDSLVAAMESIAFEYSIAESTLRLLAAYQGSREDEWRDEQPGKILHELRRGELAKLNEIPQTPYYGSVDSTPLFLILIGEHARWSGNLRLFHDLRDNIERALRWIDVSSSDGTSGYLSYTTKSRKGLGNQGWKDSGDAIMNADGSLAAPPIALVEVQGYVYRAKEGIAELYERSGDRTKAARLRTEAAELQKRFNADFWLDDKQFYALALQKEDRPAAVISSNPGQALWSGIIDPSRAAAVVHRLTQRDMFSGWGIRTLSTQEPRANPIGYHLGTVWPHDNAIIAAGFRRYGFDREALQVMHGILHAARHFAHFRLPELFAGFSREQFSEPMRYPVACHPQAWAAGSLPFLLTTLLGLVPDAFNGQLRVVRPLLPNNVDELVLRRVKVGEGSADLHFRRRRNQRVDLQVEHARGLEVKFEPDAAVKAA